MNVILREQRPSIKRSMLIKSAAITAFIFSIFFLQIDRAINKMLVWSSSFIYSEADSASDPASILLIKHIADLEQELARTNKFLSNVAQSKQQFIEASVALYPGYLFADTMLINRGVESGIADGDIVVNEWHYGVGKITQSGNGWSKIKLFSQIGERVILRAGKSKELVFEAVGIGGGELSIELPVSVPIQIGDIAWLGENPAVSAGIIDRIYRPKSRQIATVIVKNQFFAAYNLARVFVAVHQNKQ